MFKFVTFALFALAAHNASARPQDSSTTPIAIVSQSQTGDGTGNFAYAFESADGVKEEATGSLKTIDVPVIDPATGQSTGTQPGQGIINFLLLSSAR